MSVESSLPDKPLTLDGVEALSWRMQGDAAR
jgi:hypothetical protein